MAGCHTRRDFRRVDTLQPPKLQLSLLHVFDDNKTSSAYGAGTVDMERLSPLSDRQAWTDSSQRNAESRPARPDDRIIENRDELARVLQPTTTISEVPL